MVRSCDLCSEAGPRRQLEQYYSPTYLITSIVLLYLQDVLVGGILNKLLWTQQPSNLIAVHVARLVVSNVVTQGTCGVPKTQLMLDVEVSTVIAYILCVPIITQHLTGKLISRTINLASSWSQWYLLGIKLIPFFRSGSWQLGWRRAAGHLRFGFVEVLVGHIVYGLFIYSTRTCLREKTLTRLGPLALVEEVARGLTLPFSKFMVGHL
jgi:hypothetical protein